ncbi:MAG TPA: hypothetical protein VGM81_03350 [Burkholderiaceae bacterium]|jgi:hypothetical protein
MQKRSFFVLDAAVLIVASLLLAAALPARAQGGPPMVTDDPGTPGDGHWEINFGAITAHTRGRTVVAAPDIDLNYGWGDHIQLKIDAPWVSAHGNGPSGQGWKSGTGDTEFGVKWRFIDEEKSGFSLSAYPQLTRSLTNSSIRRGLAGAGHEFFLPLELAGDLGDFSITTEAGRNFVQDGPNEWVAGIVVAHDCGVEGVECMAELHTVQAPGARQTLFNMGLHWKLEEALTFLAAVGRDFGSRSDERRQALVYLGLQFTH